MKRLTRVERPPFSPAFVESTWRRLRTIEDILGEDYDLRRLKALVTGDNYTEEDMSAAYTSGFSTGMEQGMEKIERNNKARDLQPVVRCTDCKHWMKDVPGCTDFVGRCGLANYMVGATGYCVYGERRRDDE